MTNEELNKIRAQYNKYMRRRRLKKGVCQLLTLEYGPLGYGVLLCGRFGVQRPIREADIHLYRTQFHALLHYVNLLACKGLIAQIIICFRQNALI